MDNKDKDENKINEEENKNVEESKSSETLNDNTEESNEVLDELKKEIESQMSEVNDILNGTKESENVIDLSQVSSSNKIDMEKTSEIEFDGGKTEIIQVVDREFTPEGMLEENLEEIVSDIKAGKKKKKLSKRAKIIIISSIVGIIAMLGIVFGVYLYKAGGSLQDALLNVASDVVGDQDPIFVLLLGVSEDISTELTDTIILCGYNPDTQKAFMLSIPRDTFVGENSAWANGYDKINAKYQSGVEKTVEAVEKLTGAEIDNYVVVKNNALPALVDAIGTVEFDVPIDMNYDDPTQDLHIHLEAGLQEIDGDKAEQLLRFRHNNNGTSYPVSYGDNDYGRMKTQREFIKVVAKNLIKVNNVSKLKSIATAVYENIETNLSLTKVLGYVPHVLKLDVEELRMEQLPGQSAMINQLWFYKANAKKTKELMDELIYDLGIESNELKKYYKGEIDETKVIENKAKATEEEDEEEDYTTKVDRSNNDSITSDNDLKEYIKTQEETIKSIKETTTSTNNSNTSTTNQVTSPPVTKPASTEQPSNNGGNNSSSGSSKPDETQSTGNQSDQQQQQDTKPDPQQQSQNPTDEPSGSGSEGGDTPDSGGGSTPSSEPGAGSGGEPADPPVEGDV